MIRWFWICGFLSTCLLGSGCSGAKPVQPVEVSGTVTIDGKPLNDGQIVFVGEAGTLPDVLQINNGTFAGGVKPGKKKVEIKAFRPAKPPATATDTSGEFKENYLPARFNETSKLTAEVTESGLNPNKFEVQAN